jgi:hypothetical protein
MKRFSLYSLTVVMALVFMAPHVQAVVINLSDYQKHNLESDLKGSMLWEKIEHQKGIPGAGSNGKNWGKFISLVKLSGKINHFGYDITQVPPQPIDYHATVPDVKIWIAEYPFTKDLDIRSDDTGWWTLYVVKTKDVDLEFSFIYEKQGWVTTKSNAITVTDEDNIDIAIQFIDPYYYNLALKPAVEAMIGSPITNAMVVTVGKSWASMHDDRLPHGDPGATVSSDPPLFFPPTIGPIYFNEAVQPDPTRPYTSVDGGVTWINVPLNTYYVTAHKSGVNYETVKFNISEADVESGVELYIASPPDSVQGDNDSGPGLW